MKIDTRRELECTYETLAGLIRECDRCARELAWTPSQQTSASGGIEAQKRKIERDIQGYLAAHPEPERVRQQV